MSYYNFARWLPETRYQGTFDQFFERFMSNRTTYSPFLDHNLEFWNHRMDKNVMFLFYEDLKKDLLGNVKKIADFMDKNLTVEETASVVESCSFSSMAKTKGTLQDDDGLGGNSSKFFRKGIIGDWKNYFNKEQSLRMDQWVKETLDGSGLSYTYEA